MKTDTIGALLVLALILAIFIHSCIRNEDVQPESNEKTIQFISMDGHWIEYSGDPKSMAPVEKGWHDWEPKDLPDPLLLCDSLVEYPDPQFISLGSFTDTMQFTPQTAYYRFGEATDTFIVNGVQVKPFEQSLRDAITLWHDIWQYSFDSLYIETHFVNDPAGGNIQCDYFIVVSGTTLSAGDLPLPYLHYPDDALKVIPAIADEAISNTYLRDTALWEWFVEFTSVRTFTSGGTAVMDSTQLHEAIEVLVDSCQAVDGGIASLLGVGVDSMQTDYLIQSGRIIIE